MQLLPIHAFIAREAMRTRLNGALAGDAVTSEASPRRRRRLLTRPMRRG